MRIGTPNLGRWGVWAICLTSLLGFDSGSEAVLACRALSQPTEHVGRQIVFEGVLVLGEHAGYLRVYENCPTGVIRIEDPDGHISRAEYMNAGGGKVIGVLVTVRG